MPSSTALPKGRNGQAVDEALPLNRMPHSRSANAVACVYMHVLHACASLGAYLCIVGKAIRAGSPAQAQQDLLPLALAVGDVCANVGAVEHAVGLRELAVVGKVEVGAPRDAGVGGEHVHEAHDDDVHLVVVAVVAQRLFVLLRTVLRLVSHRCCSAVSTRTLSWDTSFDP